ncbi:MAG TPA: hypothetical protein VE843_10590 [Ktedonobacteraceae bacterium]|nr:hypothetical protein [Ktedonobacteraceae bacterium]
MSVLSTFYNQLVEKRQSASSPNVTQLSQFVTFVRRSYGKMLLRTRLIGCSSQEPGVEEQEQTHEAEA